MLTPHLAALLLKMGLVTVIVLAAAAIAERARPAVAALVATLPVSVGPAFVLLALDHDADFMTVVALKSAASIAATMAFILAYTHGQKWFGAPGSLAIALAAWLSAAWLTHSHTWPAWAVAAFLGATALICLAGTYRFRSFQPKRAAFRRWWDIPVRTAGVVALVGTITVLSEVLGPSGSGTLAGFPIIMTSMAVIVRPRVGGEAVAAVFANATDGMLGIGLALLGVSLTIPVLGVPLAMLAGLLFCMVWNFALFLRAQKNRVPPEIPPGP